MSMIRMYPVTPLRAHVTSMIVGVALTLLTTLTASAAIWQPTPGTTWQWQLDGPPIPNTDY